MSESGRNNDDPNHPQQRDDDAQRWESSLGGSSLADSSLDDNRHGESGPGAEQASGSHPLGEAGSPPEGAAPNPFSREAAEPGKKPASAGTSTPVSPHGAEPEAYPAAEYPAASDSDGAGQAWSSYPTQAPDSDYQGYGGQPNPYGTGSNASPYGAPDPQAQPDQGYPQQSIPVYGGAPEGLPPGYGSPYDPNPYQMNPYQANPYQPAVGGYSPYGMPAVAHPQATVSMILGIVGLAACPLVGPGALVLGRKARNEIDAEPQRYTGRGMATAGVVLGILGTIYLVLVVLGVILLVAGSSAG